MGPCLEAGGDLGTRVTLFIFGLTWGHDIQVYFSRGGGGEAEKRFTKGRARAR